MATMGRTGAEDGARDPDARSLLGDGHGRTGRADTSIGRSQGQQMTALELLELLESNPADAWVAEKLDGLTGIATPGDVDPTLARQFVFGRALLEAAGVEFSEVNTQSGGAPGIQDCQGRHPSHVRGSPRVRMIRGEKRHAKDLQALERCHELAIEASRVLGAVREKLPEAPIDFDDGDTSLPAQLARVGGLVDDILDASHTRSDPHVHARSRHGAATR